MGDSIRSLTVKLGYDIDTTGADIFKSRFNRLKNTLRKGTAGLKNRISIRDMFKKTNLSAFERDFNKKFKAAGNRIKSNAKKVLAGIAVAVAAGVAAAVKVFTGFATIEQARTSLEFKAGPERFKALIKEIDKARSETGGLVSELDAINAFNLGSDVIGDFDFLSDKFVDVIKFAKVLGKDVGEVQQIFASFIKSGSNLEQLTQFGFFKPEELEALKKAGTDFSQQGLETRKALLGKKIEERRPELDESFEKFRGSSTATLNKLGTVTEDVVVALGENLAPTVNKVAKALTESIDTMKKDLKESGSIGSAILEGVSNLFGFGKKTTPAITPTVGNTKNATVNDNSRTANQITVNGAQNPDATAKAVKAELDAVNKKVIQSSARREIPQALNTIIQPAE